MDNSPLGTATRFDLIEWFQSFRSALEVELGGDVAASEIFSMPSFWMEHILISDPVAIAKEYRFYQPPGQWPIQRGDAPTA